MDLSEKFPEFWTFAAAIIMTNVQYSLECGMVGHNPLRKQGVGSNRTLDAATALKASGQQNQSLAYASGFEVPHRCADWLFLILVENFWLQAAANHLAEDEYMESAKGGC